MRESSTYRAIIREGKREAFHELLLKLGAEQFGRADATTRKALLAIKSLNRLKDLLRALPDAAGWADLLEMARLKRRRRAKG